MKLYVCGYSGEGFGSGFIKWFTSGPFSHVSLVFEDNIGDRTEIDSIQGLGVRKRRFDPQGRYFLFEVLATIQQIETAFDIACYLIGAKYDWWGLFGFIRRSKTENPSKWFCSEFVAYILEQVQIVLQRMPYWKQHPSLVCSSVILKPIGGTMLLPYQTSDQILQHILLTI